MYRASEGQLKIEEFDHPFGGSLDPENRWVKLSRLVPWKEVEKLYADRFPRSSRGRPAFSVRVALGSLLVKERQGYSDEELVESIRENPYLQFFIGFREYRNELPFHPTLLVDFRKRLDPLMSRINELIALSRARREGEKSAEAGKGGDNPPPGGGAPPNRGKLLLDATCAPADVAHPTDLKLVNAAREKTEEIVDRLHAPLRGEARKPRTYRKKARRLFLAAVRKKGQNFSAIRKAAKKQLNFLKRNLRHIDALSRKTPLWVLPRKLYKDLLVVSEIYRQQRWMNRTGSRRVDDRIVSVSQPHVRPVVRGKTSAPVEFGAKIAISMANGLAFVDRIGRDNFPEAALLREQVESYRRRFGFYPASVHADQIYRNRENRRFCKERGIRLSGRPPGRPPSDPAATKAMAEQVRQDERDRNPVEGKFGEGKRRYGLNRIMARLPDTSSCAIALTFVVMNLEKLLRAFPDLLFALFLALFAGPMEPIKALHDRRKGVVAA
jgi:transposase, IS5 family